MCEIFVLCATCRLNLSRACNFDFWFFLKLEIKVDLLFSVKDQKERFMHSGIHICVAKWKKFQRLSMNHNYITGQLAGQNWLIIHDWLFFYASIFFGTEILFN